MKNFYILKYKIHVTQKKTEEKIEINKNIIIKSKEIIKKNKKKDQKEELIEAIFDAESMKRYFCKLVGNIFESWNGKYKT